MFVVIGVLETRSMKSEEADFGASTRHILMLIFFWSTVVEECYEEKREPQHIELEHSTF